jgi:hypothetical protein
VFICVYLRKRLPNYRAANPECPPRGIVRRLHRVTAAAVQMPDGRTGLGQPANCLKSVASKIPQNRVGKGLALTRHDGRNVVDHTYRSADSGGWHRGIL